MTVRRSGLIRRQEPFHAAFIIAALAILVAVRFIRRSVLGALI